jgi:hypothetical protein
MRRRSYQKIEKKENHCDDNDQKTMNEKIKRRVHLRTISASLVRIYKKEYYEKCDDSDDAQIAILSDNKRESKNHECLSLSNIKKNVKHDDDVAAEKQIQDRNVHVISIKRCRDEIFKY